MGAKVLKLFCLLGSMSIWMDFAAGDSPTPTSKATEVALNEIEDIQIERMLQTFKQLFGEDNRPSVAGVRPQALQLSKQQIESGLRRIPNFLGTWLQGIANIASRLTIMMALDKLVHVRMLIERFEAFMAHQNTSAFLLNPGSAMAQMIYDLLGNNNKAPTQKPDDGQQTWH